MNWVGRLTPPAGQVLDILGAKFTGLDTTQIGEPVWHALSRRFEGDQVTQGIAELRPRHSSEKGDA